MSIVNFLFGVCVYKKLLMVFVLCGLLCLLTSCSYQDLLSKDLKIGGTYRF